MTASHFQRPPKELETNAPQCNATKQVAKRFRVVRAARRRQRVSVES
jgi:hypothetical protein